MNIVIDARWIFREISGIGAYTRELIAQLAIIDKDNSYTLLFNDASVLERTVKETCIGNNARFSTRLLPYGIFSIKNQLLTPSLLKELDADIYHSTNYMIPLCAFPARRTGKTRCITTIHDVIPMIFRDHAPRSKKARLYPIYRGLMVEIGKRADTVITDSLASAEDIRKHLCIPAKDADKVKHVYCGVSEMFSPGDTKPHSPRTILYVGRSDPYKNIVTLVKAFKDVKDQYDGELELLIAGSIDPRYPEAKETADKLGIGESVRWTGYISDEELVSLYQNAALLIHPSRYEGFGLQILEAMACGTPVICANAGSQPEVAGEAAVVLDPDDQAGFTRHALEILNDGTLAEKMIIDGFKQLEKFSWKKTAEETLAIYRTVDSGQ